MINRTSASNIEKNGYPGLNKSSDDLNKLRQALENYPTSNSFNNELSELVREIAALKKQTFIETLTELSEGVKEYIKAINTNVEFNRNGIPKDIFSYSEKVESLAKGIESCWDFFSPEVQAYFINLAHELSKTNSLVFNNWRGILTKLSLLTPSINCGMDLFKLYKQSSYAIPRAVCRAVEAREEKSTSQLQAFTKSIRQRFEKEILDQPESLDDLIELVDEWSQQEYTQEEAEAFERVMKRLRKE